MKRIIKYRVWRSALKQMFDWEHLIRNKWEFADVVSEEVDDRWMQFTGLLDKNGKEVYEGDRIAWLNTYNDVIIAVVLWNEDLVGFDMPRLSGRLIPVEIIGNIYENQVEFSSQ